MKASNKKRRYEVGFMAPARGDVGGLRLFKYGPRHGWTPANFIAGGK